jgi:hypothetical protein
VSLRAMHGVQGRDQVEATHAGSWPELLGVADGPGLALRKLGVSRCVVMSDKRSPVLDFALVALLVALAFDALSTALIWGLVQHLPS